MAQAAYDSGSMAGAIESIMAAVESAIQIVRFKEKPATAQAAFQSIAFKLMFSFSGFRGMSQFDPDISEEGPSVDFCKARIDKATRLYREALDALYSSESLIEDPDAPLLEGNRNWFGKIEGFPTLPEQRK
ncbi:hypothetical protein DVH05_004757 [Phytophthora capsici]|nr:hypothetical protein DVH05_004757 [Phytophthora capsici]